MAKMIPPIIGSEAKSPGEKEVFEILKSDPATSDWIVFHSLDTAKHVKQIFGEIDFVIVVPNKGVLVLEVKGVQVLHRINGIWKYGKSESHVGPFKQASMAMHSLRNHVNKHAPELSGLVFWSAACFPFIEFSEKSIEWHSWQVIDRRSMREQGLPKLVSNVLQSARKYLSETVRAGWFDNKKQEPSLRQMKKLSQVLRPEFELYESPRARKERLGLELKRYTAEQALALDAMEDNERVIFSGPAGTGKTLLAIESARRSAAVGKEVLFICFNKQLAAMLKAEIADISGVTVATLHHFLMTLAKLEDSGEDKKDENFWKQDLPNKALEKIFEDAEPPQYDCLLIDEVQDVLEPQYLEILDFCLKGGFKSGHWRVFGDFEKQDIYRSKDNYSIEDFLNTYGNDASRYKLRTNCRNTPQIARAASDLGGLEPGYKRVLRPDNDVPVKMQYYKDDNQQDTLLLKSLAGLLAEGYKPDEIVVLSTKTNIKASVARIKDAAWRERLEPYNQQTKDKVRYSSIHAFKGLESAVVVVTDIESLDEKAKRLFYIAASRAFQRLIVIASSRVQKEVDSILVEKRALVTS